MPGFRARFDARQLNRSHRGAESKLHAEFFSQKRRQLREYLPRIDGQFRRTPDTADQSFGIHRLALLQHFGGRKPGAGVAERGRALDELARHVGLVLMVNDVKRTGRTILQSRRVEDLVPDLTTARRHLMHDAGALPDRPDHPEVAHRRALRPRSALEHDDRAPAFRREVRMRESEDAGADDRHVCLSIRAHRNPTAIALDAAVVSPGRRAVRRWAGQGVASCLSQSGRLSRRSQVLWVALPASMLSRRDRFGAHLPPHATTLWLLATASRRYCATRRDRWRSRDIPASRHRIQHR